MPEEVRVYGTKIKMIQFHVYSGGKKRIVTFSYDDGPACDQRLVDLFNKYKVKGTFHLNGGEASEEKIVELKARYEGHEISCHTVAHGWLNRMPYQSMVQEIMNNRQYLEKITGQPVVGMSYPCSSYAYNDTVKEAAKLCGIVYSRTTKSSMTFYPPDDFLEWHPSCHHKNALELCDKFVETIDSAWVGTLFYIWGHAHEFRTDEDWKVMENILEKISGNDKVWYATNMEIYQYMTAQRSLLITADEKCIYNPTAITVWVEKDGKQIICVPAGEIVYID